MKVRDGMDKSKLKLKENDTFNTASQLFNNNDVEVIPIVDEKEVLVGLITKDDIIKNFIKGTNLDTHIKYLSLCKKNIITEDSNIQDYIDDKESYMVVKNSEGKFVGILNINNILIHDISLFETF